MFKLKNIVEKSGYYVICSFVALVNIWWSYTFISHISSQHGAVLSRDNFTFSVPPYVIRTSTAMDQRSF